MVTVSPSGNTTAAVTYTPIATNTLGSAAASVTFSSIPGTYTDLVLVCVGRSSTGGPSGIRITFNGDTGSNYSRTTLVGDGTNASSSRASSQAYIDTPFDGSASQTTPYFVFCNNYSNSTTYKTGLIRFSEPLNRVGATVGLWRSTAAITSIILTEASASTFAAGFTASLYGIGA